MRWEGTSINPKQSYPYTLVLSTGSTYELESHCGLRRRPGLLIATRGKESLQVRRPHNYEIRQHISPRTNRSTMSEAPAKKLKQEALDAALSVMTNAESPALYDVTIVCTTDDYQAEYWTKRLSEGVCHDPSSTADGSSPFPMVLAVSEDWSAGGAGNGLGTLYAYQKAARVARDKHGVDLDDLLRDKTISAALYHTAGKGTRLAPLPASENNNKPGVVRF